MIGRFSNAQDFRRALETRLVDHAAAARTPLHPIRVRVAVGRLLARLFAREAAPWVVKGGVAMELRFRPRARTTRDLDLGILSAPEHAAGPMPPSAIREWALDALREAAALDLSDGFEFHIVASSAADEAPQGGRRHSVDARLAGRIFERFHLDVGIGEPFGAGERLGADDELLAFAGLPSCSALVVPAPWQFADKLAIYTHPWTDRVNTRSKDLVDLAKFIESGLPSDAALHAAIAATFAARGRVFEPAGVPEPPPSWDAEFESMATACNLMARTPGRAIAALRAFLRESSSADAV